MKRKSIFLCDLQQDELDRRLMDYIREDLGSQTENAHLLLSLVRMHVLQKVA